MAYNLTNMTIDPIGVQTIFLGANEITTGWFGTMMLMTAFLVPFVSLIAGNYGGKRSFAGASWITMLVAVPMRYLNLIGDKHMLICIVGIASAVVWLVVSDD